MQSPKSNAPLSRWLSILGGWLLLLAVTPTGAATQHYSILVYGDSLSAAYGLSQEQGWVALLQERLTQRGNHFKVINASVSGETTDGGLRRLPETLERVKPNLVILELGGNDGLRGFPLPVIRNNLTAMVKAAQDAGAEVLLVGMRIPPNYGTRYAEGFHQLYQKVAETEKTALVPFLLEQVALDDNLMQDDQIHPTAAAQPLILDTIWAHLEPLLNPEQIAQ